MATAWMIGRCELRRRWGSLVSLAVLVSIVSGVVLTALVGAYRTSTTMDRFRDWAGASDVTYQSPDPELAAAMVEILEENPDVELAGVRNLVNAFLPHESSLAAQTGAFLGIPLEGVLPPHRVGECAPFPRTAPAMKMVT